MVSESNILSDLDKYSVREKSLILERLSGILTEPIEIDGKVYYIPEEVNQLIDDLVLQIKEISSVRFPLSSYGDIEAN